jgi:arylsulfatase A-like enzyme
LLAGIALGAAVSCGQPSDARQRPNVVVVVLDTTRADALSSYGNPKPTTPHIDALARQGLRLTSAFSTDFWTLPAHASLFTGLYPSDHQATAETNLLRPEVDTLAERLRRAGYRTAAFVTNPWLGAERGFDQGFETYVEMWSQRPLAAASDSDEKRATQQAALWARDRVANAEPFFLFVNLNTPHLPYSPDPLVLVKLSPEARPLERTARLRHVAGMWGHLAGAQTFDETDFQILRDLYDAEVATADALVGRLVEALREEQILDETLVIVTSDHGENIGDHGRIDHLLSMYETTVRIPMVLRYPKRIAAGSVDDSLVSLVDVSASVLDICGLGAGQPGIAGRSLVDPDRSAPMFVVAENERPVNGIKKMRKSFPSFDTDAIDQRMRMLRTERHKLIWSEKSGSQLFDLHADPGEQRDLAASDPELLVRLEELLFGWMREHSAETDAEPFESRDPEALRRLRALGYIE